MKSIYYFLFLMLQFILLCQFSHAMSDRYALVIGNSNYEGSILKNPVNDARLMSETLKTLGFKVTELIDADIRAMDEAVIDFGRNLARGGVGLFYFAGHGIQYQSKNYLIPLHTNIIKETDLKYEAFNVGKVFDEMGYADNGLNIVILDACRDNPLIRSFRRAKQGLAETSDAPSGLLLAYSTSPGKQAADGIGENSPYTSHLVAAIKKEGLPLELVFKEVIRNVKLETSGQQIPWVSSSVDADFYFNRKNPVVIQQQSMDYKIVPSPQSRKSDNSEAQFELMYWESVVNNPSKDKYRSYLTKYPTGHFKEIAESEIRQLQKNTIQSTSQSKSYSTVNSDIRALSVSEKQIKICEKHLKAYRLSRGANGNALSCYNAILKKYPENKAALLGLSNIEDAYVQLIHKSIDNDRSEKTKRYMARLESINPKNTDLLQFKEFLASKKKPDTELAYITEEQKQIFDEYLEIIVEMLDEGALNAKEQSKVKQYLLKLQKINSSDPGYLSLERKFYARYSNSHTEKIISENDQQVFNEYLEVIDEMMEEQALNKKQRKKIDKYLNKLQKLNPHSPELMRVKNEYNKIK